jgi:hypothetical protein
MPASNKKVTKPSAKVAAVRKAMDKNIAKNVAKRAAKVRAANAAADGREANAAKAPKVTAEMKAALTPKGFGSLIVGGNANPAKPTKPAKAGKATAALTPIERQAIEGILASDYMDGMTGNDAVGHRVWTWSANPFASKPTFSGAASSLVKKGFAAIDGAGKDACIQITRAGMDAFEATAAAKPVAKVAKAGKASAATTKPAKAAKPAKASAKPATDGVKAPTGAKATIIAMIERKDGASAAEVCKKLGWVKAGATIGRAIKLAPFKVRKERDADGALRYYREG